MTKHTPGPWSVYEDCNKVAAHKAQFPAIGTMGSYYTESITNDRGEFYNKADALLVSAAPDLLDALVALLEVSKKSCGLDLKEMVKAREAINKATGAQQ